MAPKTPIIFTLFILLLEFLLAASFAAASEEDFDYTCGPGLNTSPGVLIPRGDIFVKVGTRSFPVYCRLNPGHFYYARDGYKARHLEIYVANSKFDKPRKLASRIINDTTIVAQIDPDHQRSDVITCKLVKEEGSTAGVCAKNIFVGTAPQPPKDFQCVSENWENLNCTWVEPENPVKTEYTLSYLEPGRFGR